ncbi:non-specific serine/threonine protein kinase [Malassezia brasiliensis]|uniref:non-specific serine/threonine protein kinase n=1 Tax=Malassezia brasiliensis TaxID=1821822 RepID=A0AAF0E0E2_9BASI|nr:non-specific serine/threonine protein kinase [Malassezia brasiliensis]
MGNALSGTSNRLGGAGELMLDSQLQYESSMGSSRFLRATRVRHPLGPLVVKTFIKPDASMRLRRFVRRLKLEREALSDVPNVLTYQEVIETEEAGYLVRQWLMCSLYDRISTRPFLAPCEKLWISYQLLYAMSASSERHVAHGDLKCENVLVTSSLSVYITDFASSFKPTYLPLDDPTDFSLFFDTARRRTCYVAPERFYDSVGELTDRVQQLDGPSAHRDDVENVSELLTREPYLEMLGLGRPSGCVTEKMDVFSLGCVLAELWRDGAPLFTLSQLFRYRDGQYNVGALLAEIPHEGIRGVIARMVHVDPAKRPAFAELLADASASVFPPAYATFLHAYLVELQRPSHGTPEPGDADVETRKLRLARALEPDERVEQLYEDWALLVPSLGAMGTIVDGAPLALGVCLPHVALPEPAPRRARAPADTEALIVLSVLLANVRNCRRATARCHAIEMMVHLAYGWLTDEACLDRVVPYLVRLLDDPHALCRASALHALVVVLECVATTTRGNVGLFAEYVWPHVQRLTHDTSRTVRTTYAAHLARLVQCDVRFVHYEHAERDEPIGTDTYDTQMERLRLIAQEQTLLLLTDASADVRRALLADLAPLGVFLGAARVESSLLGHLLTYFNDPDWALRTAFFRALEQLVPLLGAPTIERAVRPLLIQALGDAEEWVVVDALRSFRSLQHAGLFRGAARDELLRRAAGLLCHPNAAIRAAAVGAFAEAAAHASPTDAWMNVYLLLRPRLRSDITALDEAAMARALVAPLPRAVLNAAVAAKAHGHGVFLAYWQRRADAAADAAAEAPAALHARLDQVVRPSSSTVVATDASAPTSADEQTMLARLAHLDFDARLDAPKLVALWWYVTSVAAAAPPGARTPPAVTALDGVPQHTIFFTQQTSPARAPVRDDAVRMAKRRMQQANAHADTEAPERDPAPAPAGSEHDSAAALADGPRAPSARTPAPRSVSFSAVSIASHASRFATPPQPLVGTRAKAEASTSVDHAHAERAHMRPTAHAADEALHSVQDAASLAASEPAHDAAYAATTYDGSDPYIHAHLERVYERMAHTRAAMGMPSAAPVAAAQAWPTLYAASGARTRGKPAPVSSNARPGGTLIAHLGEHAAPVSALAVSSDQRFFVSGAHDGCVKVWDTARLEKNVVSRSRVTYAAHAAPVTALVVLTHTHCVVSAARDGTLHAYAIVVSPGTSLPRYGRPHVLGRRTLRDGEYVVCMAQLGSGAAPSLVLGTSHGRVVVWDVRCMEPLHAMTAPAAHGAVTCLAVDPARHWACTGSAHGALTLWDLRFGVPLRSWAVGDPEAPAAHAVHALALHPTHARCVLVSYGGKHAPLLDVFDLEANRVLATYASVANGDTLAPGSASRGHYAVLRTRAQRPSAALAALIDDAPRDDAGDAPVDALVTSTQGYTSSGQPPAGYAVCAGADAVVYFLDLGRVEKSVAWGSDADGEFVAVRARAPAQPATYLHQRAAATSTPLAPPTPLHAARAARALAHYVRAHKDAITALCLLELPFRCVVAGDRSGAIRVWE